MKVARPNSGRHGFREVPERPELLDFAGFVLYYHENPVATTGQTGASIQAFRRSQPGEPALPSAMDNRYLKEQLRMKKLNFKMVAARTVAAGCLLGLFMAAQSAAACTVGNWSANSGNVNAGDPNTGVARYSGLCAMETPDGEVAWVQDNSPGGINRIRARFYVLNNIDSGQSVQLYRGFSSTNGTGLLFTVVMNSGGSVVLRDHAANQTVSQAASTDWLSIEIDYAQGSGDGVISLSVNGQTPSVNSSLNNTAAALQSVRLGNLQGTGGTLNFDAYESRRTTEVGRLCVGDGNGDGSIGFPDVTEIFNEVSSAGVELSTGQPDVDENGSVGFPDVTQAFALVSTAASCN